MASQLDDVVIVEAVRTPIGRRNGSLKDVRPDELMAQVLAEVMQRAGVDPSVVDDVILGCVAQVGEQGANVARLAVLEAGFPFEVPAVSLDRMCASGQQAVHFAAQAIASGQADVVIAGGVEVDDARPDGFRLPVRLEPEAHRAQRRRDQHQPGHLRRPHRRALEPLTRGDGSLRL